MWLFSSLQPVLQPEHEIIDYDSSASDDDEGLEYEEEDEDVFKEPKVGIYSETYLMMIHI